MKVRSVIDYIEIAKKMTGAENDSRLALEHKMQPSKISNWRRGDNLPNPEMARELARWGRQDEKQIMIEREIWEAEKRGDKEGVAYWVEILRTVTRNLANSLLVAATCIAPFMFSPVVYGDFK